MSCSTTPIDKWTKDDVHRWLTTEVKVHATCAERFSEEEVSGDSLVVFEKADILDLGVKHGPAVKITSYLEHLKAGSQPRREFPAFVETWTKEQVNQWLLQHVKVYGKYAEQLRDQDVSGDCLVCFKKQDLLDLEVKSGPAVKILAELRKLSDKPEPTLQPIAEEEAPASATKPPQTTDSESKTDKLVETEAGKARPLLKKASEENELQQPRPKKLEVSREDGKETSVLSKIQKSLDDLRKDDLKSFHFCLQQYSKSKRECIPRGKLEGLDTVDTAQLLTDHYGSKEAFRITLDVLREINQREVALKLEKDTGHLGQQCLSKEAVKKEANQGDKLKDLLTCGGNSLDSYNRFVVVVNKSSPEQVQHLQFLSKLKLFCVLDFDPNSVTPGGLCHSYRESRVANLHTPSLYQGQVDSVIKNLNLYKQTSWIFCNGRHDIDGDSNKELDYKNWLRKSCIGVDHLVSFICNPEVLLQGRRLIIFLLLSPVETEKDPVFDTYKSFLKHNEEESIITICGPQSSYEKWRELIKEKCDFDISPLSINELTLNEINGTVMALGPFHQPAGRLLPSCGSSAVVLKQKDEDFMTALDILCLNQCENIYDENGQEFRDLKKKVEEEFYRGGKVKWWNFYFCDKDREKPFIKRDKYENVKKMIRNQSRNSKNICTLLNLFHDPGCGGTTLAMHVMWDLRREFRCAVLRDNELPKTEVATQVQRLMMLESDSPSPVLLLVDDSKEKENPYDLVNCIHKAAVEDSLNVNMDDTPNCKVVILNCVRSHSPMEQYRQHMPTSQFITATLTKDEKREFEKKLKELRETHETPENFYSFMIVMSSFDQKYIDKLACDTLENFDFSQKKDQLFAFLALLNNYVAESEISLSLAEDFFGMKMIHWQEDSVLERMRPYSNFLIVDTVEEYGGYKGIRILHHTLASACLEELETRYDKKVSDITMEILHCDLFFKAGVVKDKFMNSIQQMLIERQRKKDTDEREPFSSLIGKIHSKQGKQTVQEIFVKASSRFVTSASIPQALARYLYINERDFPEALKWAEKAKNIKANPYTFDTIGQLHKSNLKSNNHREKQETSHNPEDLNANIKIAHNAITAFKRAQELANTEEEHEKEAADDESDDYPRKSYAIYGFVGVLEIAFLVFEILGRLPFFEKSNPMKKKYLQGFLQKTIPITSVFKEDNAINHRYVEIIKEHEKFLLDLKTEVKETFETVDCYFTYIKVRTVFDTKNHRTTCDLFKDYVSLFCTAPEEIKKERQSNPNLNLKIDIESRRLFVEKNQADTFTGILQHLDKSAEDVEKITECYAFLQHHQQFLNKRQKTKETVNYILSNIVLHILKPKSKHVKSLSFLSDLLLKTLQDVGLGYPFPDPYYLALLLFWPVQNSPSDENTEISSYVRAIRKSAHKHLASLFRIRSTVAHLYLGKEQGLKRLVSKPQLDKNFKDMRRDILAQLWRNGDIFRDRAIINCLHRVSGTIEQGEVYANYGQLRIPVRPALIAGIRTGLSTEKVSFYLGFAINGPLAYDIQYVN